MTKMSRFAALARRLIAVAALPAFASGIATAGTLDDVKKVGVVPIVRTASSPPHGFMDPRTNKLAGIMVEIADLVGRISL